MNVQVLQGDALAVLERNDGRFKKGERRSPATEFKPGEHWRPVQPFRDAAWLSSEYGDKGRSAADIGLQFNVTEESIYYWLRKHDIPRRSMSQIRAAKHWGASGDKNPMFGKRGAEVPNWKGGATPERQAFYSSITWKRVARVVRLRDQNTCQRCGVHPRSAMSIHLHHLMPFAVRALRAESTNLVCLCGDCHRFVHSRRNTDRLFIEKGGCHE